jgi:hypothetical protein
MYQRHCGGSAATARGNARGGSAGTSHAANGAVSDVSSGDVASEAARQREHLVSAGGGGGRNGVLWQGGLDRPHN